MRSVEWSELSLAQYRTAIDYLAERNPDAAQTLADRIRSTIDALATRPIGRPGQREGTYEKAVLNVLSGGLQSGRRRGRHSQGASHLSYGAELDGLVAVWR